MKRSALVLTALLAAPPAWSLELYDNPSEVSKKVLTGAKMQKTLKEILPERDYVKFKANFHDFAAAFKLKDGSSYYEAFGKKKYAASAVVVSPKGLYYIAYRDASGRVSHYFSNDGFCRQPHGAIKVFAGTHHNKNVIVMGQPLSVKNIRHDCSRIYGGAKLRKHFAYQCSKQICRRK